MSQENLSRRKFIGLGLGTAAAAVGTGLIQRAANAQNSDPYTDPNMQHGGIQHGSEMLMGMVDPYHINGFDPMQMLVDWDTGKVSTTADGRTLREYEFSAGEHDIEIAPGILFPAWSYNGRVPGPSIRCTEGDHIRVKLS